MSNKQINTQISFLQDRIDNLEKSGFYTEKEMDKQTPLLREKINFLRTQNFGVEYVLGVSAQDLSVLVTTLKSCKKQKKLQNTSLYFAQMHSPALKNTWNTFGRNKTSIQG
jgi:hypothetical protein